MSIIERESTGRRLEVITITSYIKVITSNLLPVPSLSIIYIYIIISCYLPELEMVPTVYLSNLMIKAKCAIHLSLLLLQTQNNKEEIKLEKIRSFSFKRRTPCNGIFFK